MTNESYGAMLRDDYTVIGYSGEWLIAVNEEHSYFFTEAPSYPLEVGTVCDAEMELKPVRFMPAEDYQEFIQEYGLEV